jgi:hypothetical protein
MRPRREKVVSLFSIGKKILMYLKSTFFAEKWLPCSLALDFFYKFEFYNNGKKINMENSSTLDSL